jgi:chorismate mutase
MIERVAALVRDVLDRNAVTPDDVVSILFTATDDLHSMFPAEAARTIGLGDVPLICAREIDVDGAMARCVRLMAHVETERARADIEHVYHHGARALRPDLSDS